MPKNPCWQGFGVSNTPDFFAASDSASARKRERQIAEFRGKPPSIQVDEKFDIGVVAQLFYVRLSRPLEFGCRYPVPHGGAVFVEE